MVRIYLYKNKLEDGDGNLVTKNKSALKTLWREYLYHMNYGYYRKYKITRGLTKFVLGEMRRAGLRPALNEAVMVVPKE
jgi:ribosomal protein L13E